MSIPVKIVNYFDTLQLLLADIAKQSDFNSFRYALIDTLMCQEVNTLRNSIYVAGNGGSFSTASHVATDISYLFETGIIKASSITTSSQAQLTRIANDYGYEYVFSRDLDSYSKCIKAVLALSVSGESPNIVNMLKKSRDLEIPTFSLLGFNGKGPAKDLSDYSVSINSKDFRIVEDMHMIIISSVLSQIS